MLAGGKSAADEPAAQRQQRALVEFASAALGESGRSSLFDLAVVALSSGLDAPCCGAIELEQTLDGRRLRLRAQRGLRAGFGEVVMNVGRDSQAGYTVEVNAPVTSADVATETRFGPSTVMQNHPLVSQLSAPVPGRSTPQGVLIAGFPTPRMFPPEEVEFVAQLGALLGSALQRLERDRAELRSREVLDGMLDSVLVMRSDGKILDANARAVELYGYSRAELLELSILDLRASSSLPDLLWQMRRAGNFGLVFETHHRRKDGTQFSCEVSSRGSMLDGEHVLVSVVRARPLDS